jgi:hypothetical protein
MNTDYSHITQFHMLLLNKVAVCQHYYFTESVRGYKGDKLVIK